MDALPPVAVESCPVEARVAERHAAEVLAMMRGKLPRTTILSAHIAPVCGLIELRLDNGNVAFTDKAGRYLIMGLMLDTATGRFTSHQASTLATQELSQ